MIVRRHHTIEFPPEMSAYQVAEEVAGLIGLIYARTYDEHGVAVARQVLYEFADYVRGLPDKLEALTKQDTGENLDG